MCKNLTQFYVLSLSARAGENSTTTGFIIGKACLASFTSLVFRQFLARSNLYGTVSREAVRPVGETRVQLEKSQSPQDLPETI